MNFALNNNYPIENKEQLIKAAGYFEKNLSRFHPDERVKAACNISLRSMDLNENINNPWVTNYSRITKTAKLSPDFKSSMRLRKEACIRHSKTLPIVNGIEKIPAAGEIIDEIVKNASVYKTTELVEMISEFDKRACLEELYDNEILDPYMTVFGSLNNPEFDGVKLAGDSTQYDLLRASRSIEKIASVKEKFGDTFADKFKKDPIRSLSDLKSPEKQILSVITR